MKVKRKPNRLNVELDCGARVIVTNASGGATISLDSPPTGESRVSIHNGKSALQVSFDALEITIATAVVGSDKAAVERRLAMLSNPGPETDREPKDKQVDVAKIDSSRWAVQDSTGWLAVRQSRTGAIEWATDKGLTIT